MRVYKAQRLIADCYKAADFPEKREANARLISAGPDLLEAAKHARTEWRLHGQLTDSCRELEAAIAKAEEEMKE